tara:strand:+ start:447 stop:1286 length:840 start_codon:yes stop_codon:yes gene_type:complete
MNKIFFIILLLSQVFANKSDNRIVTIGGSVTETVFELGAGKSVVAVDWSSRIPAKVSQLPQVGYLRQLSSEGVLSMNPNKILTSSEIGPPKVVEQLASTGLDFHVYQSPQSFEQIIMMINDISILLEKERKGKRIIKNLKKLDEKVKTYEPNGKDSLRVMLFMNPTPISYNAAGSKTRADYLIEYIGGINVFEDNFARYSKVTKEDIIYANPDVILVGYVEMLNPNQSDLTGLFTDNSSFKYLPAIKNNKVFAIDIGKYLNFGPSFVENAFELKKMTHK